MARQRRIGLASSETRRLLLDAAETIMIEDGYAAVTSRRVGTRADLKPQLVHYYFPAMEDLFIALHRRRHDRMIALATDILRSDEPLLVLWQQCCDRSHVKLTIEFMALANHRSAIRAEMTKEAELFRDIQHSALTRHFAMKGTEPPIPVSALIILLTSVGTQLAMQGETGLSFGHEETQALMERLIEDVSAGRPVWRHLPG